MNKIRSIQDIVDWGLCVGCGACYAACKKQGVQLFDVAKAGIRPRFDAEKCGTCTDCLAVCPGYRRDYEADGGGDDVARMDADLGPVLEVWEGYAAHSQFRYRGASGGVMSALALYGVEGEGMSWAIQTGMDESAPWRTHTYLSYDRETILRCAGSRYAPAAPCAALRNLEHMTDSGIFLGKPCDVAAVVRMRRKSEFIRDRIGMVISHFCAGTPSTQGTLDVLSHLGMEPDEIGSLRYRGYGWPGHFTSTHRSNGVTCTLPYRDLWAMLQHYCPLSCRLCPDGLGWFADISCGDAWYLVDQCSIGHSLMIVRTGSGRRMLRKAIEDRYIIAVEVSPETVVKSQQALIRKRQVLHGRLKALAMLGIPTTDYQGFQLSEYWRTLPPATKVKEMIGTWKRVLMRKLWHPRPLWQNGQGNALPLDVETWMGRESQDIRVPLVRI